MVVGLKQQISLEKENSANRNLQLLFKFLGLEMQGHFICRPFN